MPDLSQMHKGRDTQKRSPSPKCQTAADSPKEKWIFTEYGRSCLYAFFRFPAASQVLQRYLRGFSFPARSSSSLPPAVRREGRDALWVAFSPENGQRDSETKEFKNGGIQIETLRD
jgi:hypothetical protein